MASRAARYETKTKWRSILLLVICEAMALALWFSATAIIPVLKLEFPVDDTRASLFSSIVAVGYVAGTLGSAVFGLADRLNPRRFFAASALTAAAANVAILLFEPTSIVVVALRFITGICMAGLYPVGMKMAATWSEGDTGLLISILVAGLTLGAALPHIFNALGALDWRFTLIVASSFAVTSSILVNFVGLGPRQSRIPPFEPSAMMKAWTDKSIRLANFGYFGHLWELYAMWAWVALFLHASFSASMGQSGRQIEFFANLATFVVIAAGAVGCILLGFIADRVGRTAATAITMLVSATCALAIGPLFGQSVWLVFAVCLVWGFFVVPDAPQTSACVIELADPSHVGTMLTIQTCVGFMLTPLAIHLVPQLVEAIGWQYAFAPLALGPVAGAMAMWRLRTHPKAIQIAHGKR